MTFFSQVIVLFRVSVIWIEEICKHNSVLCNFHVLHQFTTLLCIFSKCVRIKIKYHKICVRMSILLSMLDKVNASYACKYNSILCDFHVQGAIKKFSDSSHKICLKQKLSPKITITLEVVSLHCNGRVPPRFPLLENFSKCSFGDSLECCLRFFLNPFNPPKTAAF